MATAIVKSIGTAGGRDYSTFAAFEAAIPASLVTADETWTGEAYNDSEFTAAFNISGHTTDATRWILVTAAAGESFADHADKLTNALAYDQSKGVGLNVNTGYAIVTRAQDSYVTFSRLQIRSYATLGTTDCVDITAANNRVENCIIDKVSGAGRALKIFSSTTEAVNCLIIQRVANQQGVSASSTSRCVNVTCVSPSDVTSTSTGFGAAYTNNIAVNCASFGFSTDYSASGWDTTNSKNNASDSTGNPGTASQDSLTFADQFETVTATGMDLRVKSGSGLIDNGIRDATYTLDLDIIGQDRSLTTPTIGCWEFVSAGGVTLTVQDATHGHTADNIALTQANQLAVNGSTHAHTADNLDLSQAYSLTVQEALHGHVADNLALTQANTLALQDALHAHEADNIVLVQANVLAVQDAIHAHTADNLDLTQANTLAVQDAIHAHTADNLELAVGGTLEVQDSQHAHAADNIALTQANVLVVGDATHGHTAGNITLVSGIQLIVQEAAHAHAADNMVLTQANVLAIQDAIHSHIADNLDLTQANVLIMSDALHAHIADNIALTIPSGLDIETPYGRVFVVSAQDRTYAIIKSDRTAAIPGDDRTYVIH